MMQWERILGLCDGGGGEFDGRCLDRKSESITTQSMSGDLHLSPFFCVVNVYKKQLASWISLTDESMAPGRRLPTWRAMS
jgi:hypothetical protein